MRPQNISPAHYTQQNEYTPLEIGTMRDQSEQLHEKSVLHFIEGHTLSFDTKIRVVGCLTSESITRLEYFALNSAAAGLGTG